jgi:AraC-like DNA-binding protein
MRRHEFVFPRTGVWIEHPGRRPFIADPTVVTFYNRDEPYRRRALSADGDRCDWYAFDPAVLAEVLGRMDPTVADRPHRPFRFTHGPVDAASYAEQRLVAHHLERAEAADAVAVEEVMLDVLRRVAGRAYARRGIEVAPPTKSGPAVETVERVRQHALAHLGDRLTLARLATVAGCSPYRLCRSFRHVTGGRLHSWLLRLRLQVSLERVAEPRSDLTSVALDLGFASHSHFTAAFRAAFGLTPSELRRRASVRHVARLATWTSSGPAPAPPS